MNMTNAANIPKDCKPGSGVVSVHKKAAQVVHEVMPIANPVRRYTQLIRVSRSVST